MAATAGFMASVTCGLTAEDRDQLLNPMESGLTRSGPQKNSMVKQQPKVVVTAAIVVVVVAVAVCDSVLCSASNSLVLEPLIVKMLTFNVGP